MGGGDLHLSFLWSTCARGNGCGDGTSCWGIKCSVTMLNDNDNDVIYIYVGVKFINLRGREILRHDPIILLMLE